MLSSRRMRHGCVRLVAARHGVAIEAGPVERHGRRGGGRSVYFRDPDGSLLELLTYA